MELVGTAEQYYEDRGDLRVIFRCTNREEFNLLVPRDENRIPEGVLVRARAYKPGIGLRLPKKEIILMSWEEI